MDAPLEAAPPPQVPPRPRRVRWPLVALWAGVVVLAAIIVGAWWLVATPGGARVVLDRAAPALGKSAEVEGSEGRRGGALRSRLIESSRTDLHQRGDAVVKGTGA